MVFLLEKYLTLLTNTVPFSGFSAEEVSGVLSSLRLTSVSFSKGTVIFSQGEKVSRSGIILCGSITAQSVSYSGQQRVISVLSEGDVFGDVLMSSEKFPIPVSVIAREDTEVLFLSVSKLTEKAEDPLCMRVLLNMLRGVSEKFWMLNRKIAYLSAKSLRARIALFLLDNIKDRGVSTFKVDYSREELASLLSVNRSALSRELSRMQDEGMLEFYKSSFRILDSEALKRAL